MNEIAHLIKRIQSGNRQASEELLPLVYQDLRRLAQHRLNHLSPGQTLQATGLVHEAYLRLVDAENKQDWDSKGHFFSAAAESMRRILVEKARKRARKKHGGDFNRADISMSEVVDEIPVDDLETLDSALTKFEHAYPDKAELIKLRFFAGLTEEQAANALGISRATASRYWTFGRTWLFSEMRRARNNSQAPGRGACGLASGNSGN